MSSSDDGHDEDASASHIQAGKEPLACVTCRARKLKCDRTKPACARCTKVNSECVYPESRRKPTFKRRNVRELEERLAQVETLLKGVNDVTKDAPREEPVRPSDEPSARKAPRPAAVESEQGWDYALPSHGTARTVSDGRTPSSQVAFTDYVGGETNAANTRPDDWQLMELGLTEAPPPWEVIEELTDNYFNINHYFVPIIHPGKYRQAMYAGPYMQPPMCLQYIIWAMSAHHHEKYNSYSDVFYRRSRSYFEKDEMRGDGEHFVTIPHAQTLILIASYEAKRMLFTRAAMNTAKCVRLINMMGLEKLDGGDESRMGPVLHPCKNWTEKEEHRRVFWGAYAIDAHASVSTGWPTLINSNEIRTRLPSSEAAFATGKEELTPFIEEIFDGAEYSTFASTLVSCHVYKSILNHVHRPKHTDHPEDVVKGPFWERHRGFDTMLSSLLMFLPPNMRLHNGNKEPAAIYLNMNLHAAIICLNHAAVEQAEKYNLSPSMKQASIARMRSSAMEIANISKLAANMTQCFKSPLCSLSLYTATTVYVFLGKRDPVTGLGSIERSNLEHILRLMEGIGRVHEVTNAFLQQAWNDIDRNGLDHIVRNWRYQPQNCTTSSKGNLSSIPLISRTNNVHESQDLGSIIPGKLPIDLPKRKQSTLLKSYHDQLRMRSGTYDKMAVLLEGECFQAVLGAVTRNIGTLHEPSIGISHKRKRMSHSPGPDLNLDFSGQDTFLQPNILMPANATREMPFALPDRTGSSSSSSPAYRGSGTDTQLSSGSSGTSPGMFGLGNTAEENRIDLRQFQGRVATPQWDPSEFMFGEVTDEMVNEALGGASGEPWSFLTADIPWPGQGGQIR